MHTLRCFLALILLSVVTAISGCAGTASGTKSSVDDWEEVDFTPERARSTNALVLIRYPALLEEEAREAYFRAFESNAIGGEVPPEKHFSADTERVATAIIAKSNYFAMSLYRELQNQLPPDTVLLSPHVIEWAGPEGLSSRPLLKTEKIPAVLTVDFSIYSYPDPELMMDSPPLTFGDIVTPLVVMHTSYQAGPATHGLILVSEPLLATAWKQARETASKEFSANLNGSGIQVPANRSLDFANYLSNGASDRVQDTDVIPTLSMSETWNEQAVLEYQVEKIELDGELMEDVATAGSSFDTDPFADGFAEGFANRVIKVLIRIQHDKATVESRQAAIAAFDPEAAALYHAGVNSEGIRARIQLAEALIKAERQFLSTQSQKLYDGVYEGRVGQELRELIAAEYETLEKRRDLANEQNFNTFMGIFAGAMAVYGQGQAISASAQNPQLAQSLRQSSMNLYQMSMISSQQASAAQIESQAIGENFLVAMAPALEQQVSVQVELLEGNEQITAKNFAEFKMKLQELYRNKVRSMSATAMDCSFRDPAASRPGRWYGECANGFAIGRGHGLIVDDNDRSIEYFGDAYDGMADGIGYMIVNVGGVAGATSFEGEFFGGTPNGVMRVRSPGETAKIRIYESGTDVGKGKPTFVKSVFE